MTIHWRKSSYSQGVQDETCVELARFPSSIGVRDSKNPYAGNLALTSGQFTALVSHLKNVPGSFATS